MNIIKLCGGLGNQIFQYAFGKAQMQNGIDVKFDKNWFDSKNAKSPLRLYLLDKFETDVDLIVSGRSGKPVFSEKGFDSDLLTPSASNLSMISSSTFSFTALASFSIAAISDKAPRVINNKSIISPVEQL